MRGGVGGQIPQPLEARSDFWGGTSDAAAILQLFSKKICIFKHILAQISAKNRVF